MVYVSIHARAVKRARLTLAQLEEVIRFVSIHARAVKRARLSPPGRARIVRAVSIHARAVKRARLGGEFSVLDQVVLFQSTRAP